MPRYFCFWYQKGKVPEFNKLPPLVFLKALGLGLFSPFANVQGDAAIPIFGVLG